MIIITDIDGTLVENVFNDATVKDKAFMDKILALPPSPWTVKQSGCYLQYFRHLFRHADSTILVTGRGIEMECISLEWYKKNFLPIGPVFYSTYPYVTQDEYKQGKAQLLRFEISFCRFHRPDACILVFEDDFDIIRGFFIPLKLNKDIHVIVYHVDHGCVNWVK